MLGLIFIICFFMILLLAFVVPLMIGFDLYECCVVTIATIIFFSLLLFVFYMSGGIVAA